MNSRRRTNPVGLGTAFVFPNRKGDGPMTDLGPRWQKLREAGMARPILDEYHTRHIA